MKKFHIISGASLLPLLVLGVVIVTHQSQPVNTELSSNKKPATKQQTVNSAAAPVTTAPAAPTTVTTHATVSNVSAQPTIPTADQNKEKIKQIVESIATTRIPLFNHVFSQDDTDRFIYAQWSCIDQIIAATVGYSDYAAAYNISAMTVILQMGQNPDGTSSYRYFDGPGTCRVYPIPAAA